MKLLLATLLLLTVVIAAPMALERSSDPCVALERRAAGLAAAEAQAEAAPSDVKKLIAEVARTTNGGFATGLIHERWPNIPAPLACTGIYWRSVADPGYFETMARQALARLPFRIGERKQP